MNQHTSDFLAKKLRQNWLTRAQELKASKDQDDDDSLTNLAWLQNINLTKMAVPGTPLSPSWPCSDNLLNADTNIKEASLKNSGGRAIRNTLELYRQHCTTCYHFPNTPAPTTQTFVTMASTPEHTFPVQAAESDLLEQSRPVGALEGNYLNEPASFEQDHIP
ncbi:unnamed protein product, partial [Dibothriocephalus latus]